MQQILTFIKHKPENVWFIFLKKILNQLIVYQRSWHLIYFWPMSQLNCKCLHALVNMQRETLKDTRLLKFPHSDRLLFEVCALVFGRIPQLVMWKKRCKAVTAGWSIDQAGDGDGETRHLFTGSTILSGITAAPDYCCVWRMCAECHALAVHLHTSHAERQLMHFYHQAWPHLQDTGETHSAQVQLSHKLLTVKEVRYWLKTQSR